MKGTMPVLYDEDLDDLMEDLDDDQEMNTNQDAENTEPTNHHSSAKATRARVNTRGKKELKQIPFEELLSMPKKVPTRLTADNEGAYLRQLLLQYQEWFKTSVQIKGSFDEVAATIERLGKLTYYRDYVQEIREPGSNNQYDDDGNDEYDDNGEIVKEGRAKAIDEGAGLVFDQPGEDSAWKASLIFGDDEDEFDTNSLSEPVDELQDFQRLIQSAKPTEPIVAPKAVPRTIVPAPVIRPPVGKPLYPTTRINQMRILNIPPKVVINVAPPVAAATTISVVTKPSMPATSAPVVAVPVQSATNDDSQFDADYDDGLDDDLIALAEAHCT